MTTMLASARTALAVATLLLAGPAFADGPGTATPDVAAPPVVRAAPTPAPAPAPAPTTTPAPTAEPAAAEGRSGVIALPAGDVSLNVPASYRFYGVPEAQAFLQRAGAAAPSGEILGMVAPASTDLQAADVWASVISYEPLGYVAPETASGLTAPSFEADVRAVRATQNRAFEGFYIQPAFDQAAAGLSWAERTAAPGAGGKDFRHEQRLLGRRGVVGITSIGHADQQGAITSAAPDMVTMVGFPEGQRYADFVAASDSVSAYGVPNLVTGAAPSDPNAIAQVASTDADGASSGSGIQGLFPWIALGVAGLAGIGYVMTRKRGGDPNMDPE